MVKIPTSVQAGIQIRIGFWIIPSFFTFGQLLVDLEVLIWMNSRFLNSNQFINNYRNTDQYTGWNPNPNWALDNSGFFLLWLTSSGFRSPCLAEFEIS